MSAPPGFEDLPEDAMLHIFGYLPLEQRVRMRRVSKSFAASTLLSIRNIVFVRRNMEQDYSPLLAYFRFARHHKILVRNNIEIASTLRQCRDRNPIIESVKFMSINFTPNNAAETHALQEIGQQLVGITALEVYRCNMNDAQHLHAIVGNLATLVSLELDFFATVAVLSPVVVSLVNRNLNIKHFKLKDPHGDYVQLMLPQSLVTFHIAVEPRNLHRFLWVSLRLNSRQSLRVFKSEYFDGEQEQYLDFPNLEDIRVGNVADDPNQQTIPSRNLLPNLRVLTLRFVAPEGDDEDLNWLFLQHNNLEVLDIGIMFEMENSLNVIANSCPLLQYLSLGVEFEFTHIGVAQLLRLNHLRYLQLDGDVAHINDDQLVQVVDLPNLRTLRCNCCPVDMPLTEAAFRDKAAADSTQLYFLEFNDDELEEIGNVLVPNRLCESFFYTWGDNGPFGITDYKEWEQLNMQKLHQAFGQPQQ